MTDILSKLQEAMDKLSIREIWLECEIWVNGWDTEDDNSDVIVTLEDGSRWLATFFTFSNIVSLRDEHALSGECLSGGYFWASDMILIDKLTRDRVEKVIKDQIATGDFEIAFERMVDGEEE
ncbi:MAG: hypothetical protein IPM63_10555 [Acidobacteriota bacterium]|nr:MAG: hypothetical protein IPM63_10555 [Acidobacteriota bacterium]